MEEYSGYYDTVIYEEEEYQKPESTLYETYKLCIEPTLQEVFPHVWKLLLINFIFKCIIKTNIFPKYKYICHASSILCGVSVLYFILRSTLLYITVFIVFCYTVLLLIQYLRWKYCPYYLSAICITYLIVSEFHFPIPEAWHETRGVHMIIAMKVISIAFDIKRGTIAAMRDPLEYGGYILCPSNCLFGPWISISVYRSVFLCPSSLLDIHWLKNIIYTTTLAILFLTVSNCWAYWLIPQNYKWFVAYQEAFSFHSSHYFISYLSEAAMITGGFGYGSSNKKKKDPTWRYIITKPLAIEFPRSLVQVVVYWNIPMHTWLKIYVFQVCKPMGSFFAVIMTYLVSSFLHGCNIKLASVLLSLGLYTYTEYKLREKLSAIFDACVGANPCRRCAHGWRDGPYVRLANGAFSALALFHLAYLGCLLDAPADDLHHESQLFLKWQHLDYASHIITLFMYVIYKLV